MASIETTPKRVQRSYSVNDKLRLFKDWKSFLEI